MSKGWKCKMGNLQETTKCEQINLKKKLNQENKNRHSLNK